MKKVYIQPETTVVSLGGICAMLAGSGNNLSGTIHSGGSGETIGTGDEDDEEGMEASAKKYQFNYEW